jgi:hypothetical protein
MAGYLLVETSSRDAAPGYVEHDVEWLPARGEQVFWILVITILAAADRDGGIVVIIRLGVSSVKVRDREQTIELITRVSSVKVLDREVAIELKVAVQKGNEGSMPFSATSDGGSQLLARQVRSNCLSNFGQVHAERKVDWMDFFWAEERNGGSRGVCC